MSGAPLWRENAEGIVLRVRLTPGARSEGLDGVTADANGLAALAVKVRAVPEKGAANKALCRLLARELCVPAGGVRVISGHTARLKLVQIACVTAEIGQHLAVAIGRT